MKKQYLIIGLAGLMACNAVSTSYCSKAMMESLGNDTQKSYLNRRNLVKIGGIVLTVAVFTYLYKTGQLVEFLNTAKEYGCSAKDRFVEFGSYLKSFVVSSPAVANTIATNSSVVANAIATNSSVVANAIATNSSTSVNKTVVEKVVKVVEVLANAPKTPSVEPVVSAPEAAEAAASLFDRFKKVSGQFFSLK